jgi:hypothetical protein
MDIGMRLVWAAELGVVATLPFVVMEGIYTGGFSRGVPVAAFVILWLLASGFLLEAISILRATYDAPVRGWIGPLLMRIGVAAVVAAGWVHHINDQMPCFLGAHGC